MQCLMPWSAGLTPKLGVVYPDPKGIMGLTDLMVAEEGYTEIVNFLVLAGVD